MRQTVTIFAFLQRKYNISATIALNKYNISATIALNKYNISATIALNKSKTTCCTIELPSAMIKTKHPNE
jgi:hypothetical protein